MRLAELEKQFLRCISLSADQWAFALLLGRARERSNTLRLRTADRGSRGNLEVDLHGALGELILYGMVLKQPESEAAAAYMRRHLYVAGGGAGVIGPDLLFEEEGKPVGVDVKTFDCSTRKRYFAINNDKHLKLAGSCAGYMGLICARFSSIAFITRLIPYDDVSSWKCEALRWNGSASRNLPIDEAILRYGACEYFSQKSRANVLDEEMIREAARATEPDSVMCRLGRWLPDVEPYLLDAQNGL